MSILLIFCQILIQSNGRIPVQNHYQNEGGNWFLHQDPNFVYERETLLTEFRTNYLPVDDNQLNIMDCKRLGVYCGFTAFGIINDGWPLTDDDDDYDYLDESDDEHLPTKTPWLLHQSNQFDLIRENNLKYLREVVDTRANKKCFWKRGWCDGRGFIIVGRPWPLEREEKIDGDQIEKNRLDGELPSPLIVGGIYYEDGFAYPLEEMVGQEGVDYFLMAGLVIQRTDVEHHFHGSSEPCAMDETYDIPGKSDIDNQWESNITHNEVIEFKRNTPKANDLSDENICCFLAIVEYYQAYITSAEPNEFIAKFDEGDLFDVYRGWIQVDKMPKMNKEREHFIGSMEYWYNMNRKPCPDGCGGPAAGRRR